METQKERLMQFQKALGISMRSFERMLGMSNGAMKQTKGVSGNLLDKVCNTFPELNRAWLLTGEGDMLNTNIAIGDANTQVSGNHNKVGVPTKKFEHEEKWFALIAEKDKQIDRLLSIIEHITK